MNNILKYLSAAAQAKLQASPTILARIPADIARIEADALAEAKAEFAIMEKAELEKKQQEAKIKVEQEARSKEAYAKEVDKKHSVINEQHKGNYGEVVLEDKKQSKIYPIVKQTEPTDLFSKVKEEEAKKASIISNQKIESEKRLVAEIAETDKLNSSQFSNGIKVNSEIQFDADRKIYPISTKTTPQDTFSLFEGKSSPFLPKTQEKQELKVSLGSNSVSNNYDPYGQVKNTTYSVPNTQKEGSAIDPLEAYLKTLGVNSQGIFSEKLFQKRQQTFLTDVDSFFKIHSAIGAESFDKAILSSKLSANLTEEKKQAILHIGKNKKAIQVVGSTTKIVPYFTLPTDFPMNSSFYRIEDSHGRGPFHADTPGRLIIDKAVEKNKNLFPKVSETLAERGANTKDYVYGTRTLEDLVSYFEENTFTDLQKAGYSVKKYNYDATKALPDQLFFENNQIVVDRNLIKEAESKISLERPTDYKKDRIRKEKVESPKPVDLVRKEPKKSKVTAKVTQAAATPEVTPDAIIEDLKPTTPNTVEDKKVGKITPEPAKLEDPKAPEKPLDKAEEQKEKLVPKDETKKSANTTTEEKTKPKIEESSRLPTIPKVADAEKVEPKLRVIPPKDIKPIQADSLVSFDTETTGIDTKKSRIWQVGSATNLGEGKDYHLNPFETSPRNSQSFFQSLKNANGIFSEKAAAAGNFAGAISDFKKRKLVNLNQGLLETVGKFENTSVAVLQNANFENRLIQAAVSRGEINKDTLNMLSSKFMHSSIDKQGKLTGALFNSSAKVKEAMREAEYTFRTKFMPSRSEESFKTYTDFLNTAYRQYGYDIISAKAAGKITSVELMDISKIFYANLAERNLISKNSVQLGLNIEFLASTLLGETEKHLASPDSSQTIRLFQRLNTHIGDMLSGNITDKLKEDAAKIRENQPAEVNKKFLSTLSSRLEDLERRGYTYQTNSEFSFYSPESRQKNMATGEIENIDGITLNNEKMKLTTMEAVIQDTFRSYEHYSDNLQGFNRAAYSTKLQEDIGKGSKLGDILSVVQNTTPKVEGPTLPFNYETDFEAKGQGLQKAARDISRDTIFLGKQMKKSTAGAILAGTAATLGVMAMTDNPNKNEIDQNAPVFENFYDEQYLGTAFVEFRDRNKRYVY